MISNTKFYLIGFGFGIIAFTSVYSFNWNKLDTIEEIGPIHFEESSFHLKAQNKRSVSHDTLIPRELNATFNHQDGDVTLRFARKHQIFLPSIIVSNHEGIQNYDPRFGQQCVWLYEDDRYAAFVLVDFCHPTNQPYMIGEVFINKEKHVVLPDSNSHRLFRCKGKYDFLGAPPVISDATNMPPQDKHNRHRRQTDQENIIELMFYVDDSMYDFFYGFNDQAGLTTEQRMTNTSTEIRAFYTYIAGGMNYRYSTLSSMGMSIQIKLISIHIQTTSNPPLSGQTDSSSLLSVFTTYVRQQVAASNFPDVDHYMLITKLDLTSNGDSRSAGLANQATMCGPSPTSATSLVEDQFNFLSEVVFSHELGHGLGAVHDGVENVCSSENGYIMSAINSIQTGNSALNLWRFSDCSMTEINNFVTNLNNTNTNCLLTLNSPNATELATQGPPLGQEYAPDEQCLRTFGSSSELSRIQYTESGFETLCVGMWCLRSSQNVQMVPADRTTCGNRKWCVNGGCVNSNDAPAGDETCLFGDQPGEVSTGNTCAQLLNAFLGQCYRDNVRFACCQSCPSRRLTIPDCEFGDRLDCSLVKAVNCYNDTIRANCCKTCNDFEKADLPASCRYGDKNPQCAPNFCAANAEVCCETCKDDLTTSTTAASNTTSSSSELSDWVIPVAAGGGGLLVIVVIIIIACCIAQSRAEKNVNRASLRGSRSRGRPSGRRPGTNRPPDRRYAPPYSANGTARNGQPPGNYYGVMNGRTSNPRMYAVPNRY